MYHLDVDEICLFDHVFVYIAGIDKENTDQSGFNALHRAAKNGHHEVIKALAESGSQPSTLFLSCLLGSIVSFGQTEQQKSELFNRGG